jgi:hypothetical protein
MSTEGGTPEIAPTGAFGHPYVRPPDKVVEAGVPGVVASELEAATDEPGAALPPRSDRPAPTTSLAERWRARLEQEG